MSRVQQPHASTGSIHQPGDVPFRVSNYGDHPHQHIEWWDAPNPGRTLVLLHGGFWRQDFGAEIMHPLATTIRLHGWNVANVEYRRGLGFEAANADVGLALRRVWAEYPGVPTVVVGHSAGGHLALLHDDGADAVVALAPVTDLKRAAEEEIGENAVTEFIGEDAPTGTYVSASPQPDKIDMPTLIVHPVGDQRVPVQHTRDFVAKAREAGAPVRYDELSEGGHMDLIDPYAAHWKSVREWVAAVLES